MSLDLTCLRIMKDRKSFERFRRGIPKAILEGATDLILDDFGKFFKENPEAERIPPGEFETMFFGFYHKNLSDEQKQYYKRMLHEALTKDASPGVRESFIINLKQEDYASKFAELLTRYNDGGEVDLIREMTRLSEKAEFDLDKKLDVQFVNDDIGDLLATTEQGEGLRWRLRCLQDTMRPMIPGDFGIVAGRPDTGKTSFITDNITYFAPQVVQHQHLFQSNLILWLNNEGPGKRIKPRLFQSGLGATIQECIALHQQQKLVKAYVESLGGARIEILDIHGWTDYEVEEVIKRFKPAVVIYDMIDNIRFGGAGAGARTDQVLEGMYQTAREWGVKYEHIGIATSQISNEGDGLMFPTLGMLKDSKTGKQGACDFQLMIGRSNDFESDTARGISLPKNKLSIPGAKRCPRSTVHFDGHRGRFSDINDPE